MKSIASKVCDIAIVATKRIRGGDSFRTIYRAANHRQACAYVDNADDTYDVICRLVDECANVSIHLTYVAFGAYRWDGAYINRLIWRGTVCANASTTTTQRQNGNKNGVALAASAFVGWWRANTTQPLRWVGCSYQFVVCNCLHSIQFNSISLYSLRHHYDVTTIILPLHYRKTTTSLLNNYHITTTSLWLRYESCFVVMNKILAKCYIAALEFIIMSMHPAAINCVILSSDGTINCLF
jgi:hypothetical protein